MALAAVMSHGCSRDWWRLVAQCVWGLCSSVAHAGECTLQLPGWPSPLKSSFWGVADSSAAECMDWEAAGTGGGIGGGTGGGTAGIE